MGATRKRSSKEEIRKTKLEIRRRGCICANFELRNSRCEMCGGRYFLAAADFAAASAYFLVKRSTRPAVSISFCLPVKNGWQLEQISTFSLSPLIVERVWKLFPQAQCTVPV